jgi:hypothetical protein
VREHGARDPRDEAAHRAKGEGVERGDHDGPALVRPGLVEEPRGLVRHGDVVPALRLELDDEPGRARLGPEDLLERRDRLAAYPQLAEAGKRRLGDRARHAGQLVEPLVVKDDGLTAAARPRVELDRVRSEVAREGEGGERVLGSAGGGAAVGDDAHGAVRAEVYGIAWNSSNVRARSVGFSAFSRPSVEVGVGP